MKKSRFSPDQIAKILKDYAGGIGISSEELCRLNGLSRQTFYNGEVSTVEWNPVS